MVIGLCPAPYFKLRMIGGPLSQAAFDTYVANPECAAYLASDILEKRLHQLLRLIADGEKFTVCEAADLVFLPSEVFRFVWAEVLAAEHEATT